MARFIKRLLLTFVLVGLAIVFINAYFLNQKRYDWGEGDNFNRRISYLQQHPGEFNTVFIGSSKVIHHFRAKQFDANTEGIHSFNLGNNGMLTPKSLAMAEAILSDPSINLKFMFLELDFIQDLAANLHTQRTYYWINPENLIFVLKSILISNHTINRKIALTYQYLVSFCDKYLALGTKNSLFKLDSPAGVLSDYEIENSGYVSLDYQLTNESNDRLVGAREHFLEDTLELHNYWEVYQAVIKTPGAENKIFQSKMEELIDTAEKKGTTLIYVIQASDNMKHVYNTYTKLPPSNVIDLSLEPELYKANNHFDFSHLNDRGAELFTDLLIERFNQMYPRISMSRSQSSSNDM